MGTRKTRRIVGGSFKDRNEGIGSGLGKTTPGGDRDADGKRVAYGNATVIERESDGVDRIYETRVDNSSARPSFVPHNTRRQSRFRPPQEAIINIHLDL